MTSFSIMGQTFNYFEIVGKGDSGQLKCSGTISETFGMSLYGSIKITLSDMLEQEFRIVEKEQIDERTIKYHCEKSGVLDWEKNSIGNMQSRRYFIIKQKCNINENVYFFQFPALYEGQGTTVYKTRK